MSPLLMHFSIRSWTSLSPSQSSLVSSAVWSSLSLAQLASEQVINTNCWPLHTSFQNSAALMILLLTNFILGSAHSMALASSLMVSWSSRKLSLEAQALSSLTQLRESTSQVLSSLSTRHMQCLAPPFLSTTRQHFSFRPVRPYFPLALFQSAFLSLPEFLASGMVITPSSSTSLRLSLTFWVMQDQGSVQPMSLWKQSTMVASTGSPMASAVLKSPILRMTALRALPWSLTWLSWKESMKRLILSLWMWCSRRRASFFWQRQIRLLEKATSVESIRGNTVHRFSTLVPFSPLVTVSLGYNPGQCSQNSFTVHSLLASAPQSSQMSVQQTVRSHFLGGFSRMNTWFWSVSKKTSRLAYTNMIFYSKYSLAASDAPTGLRRGMNMGCFTAKMHPSSPLQISTYLSLLLSIPAMT